MKSTIVAFALAASALTGVAHAAVTHGSTVDVQTQQAVANRAVLGKTRAEVKQELVQAQRDGQIAALRSLYQGS
ncbi:hypothetical protein AWB70_01553 [Caballeronia cordobensis]|uniref:DUF4148 domain-containing protein n=1 Tax=Caballeronia cordobensis TaxID=1353886 RepID=A0A158G421_CABCO|nr:DUF4148 domain-containing protein [Caballeronia cordobensis]SAL26878.1 hypothetical protein AWB70_01553 [Caballeronia cordobensis]